MEENKSPPEVQEIGHVEKDEAIQGLDTAPEDQAPAPGGAEPAPAADAGRSQNRTVVVLAVALAAVVALLCLVAGLAIGHVFGDKVAGAPPTALPPPTVTPTATPVPTPAPGKPPQAVIAAPGQATVGETIFFDGSNSAGSSPLVRYNWDMGDGTQSGGVTVSHAYGRAGRYVVTLIVTDQNGLSDSASLRIQVNEPTPTPQPPQAEIRGPSEAEVGEMVAFDGRGSSSGSPIVNYAWAFGDGTQGSGDRVNHVYGRGGTYQVTLTVTDNAGRTDTATAQIAVRDAPMTPPRAVLEGPSQALAGEQVTFSGANSQPGNSPIVRYAWAFGNRKTQEGRQETATTRYDDPGQYQVELTVTDQNGLSSTAAAPIVIHAMLEGGSWHLTTVLPGTDITAQFNRGQVSGSSGCNNYSGAYTAQESSITSGSLAISALSSGQRLCGDDVMALEARYLEALQSATQYSIQGDTLTISYFGGTLVYTDRPVPEPFQ